MKRENRRRRGGNVGPDTVGIQARREGGETRSGSFPRFPRRGISTATFPPAPLRVLGGQTAEVRASGTRVSREFFQEVKW